MQAARWIGQKRQLQQLCLRMAFLIFCNWCLPVVALWKIMFHGIKAMNHISYCQKPFDIGANQFWKLISAESLSHSNGCEAHIVGWSDWTRRPAQETSLRREERKIGGGAIGDIGVGQVLTKYLWLLGLVCPWLPRVRFLDQLLGVWSIDMNQQDVWKGFCNCNTIHSLIGEDFVGLITMMCRWAGWGSSSLVIC